MPFDVFISYSHKDKATADAVCAGLESAGIRCWIAPRDIAPGTEWGEGIIGGIERCRVMVLIFSANANQSHHIRREVERAASKEMPILPFRIENILPNSKLEFFLGDLHWLDALTPPLAGHVERLIEAIKSLLALEPVAARLTAPAAAASPPRSLRRRGRRWMLGGGAGLLAVLAGAVVWWTVGQHLRAAPERDQQVITLAETVRNDVDNGAFEDAEKRLAALASLAPSSGHTFYFEGELQRIMRPNRDVYRAIDWFVRYADDPRNAQILASDRLDGQSCYESAAGFCRHRSGWIMQLLANIFYRLSTDETIAAAKRKEYLDQAGRYVAQSLKFYPKGFPATTAAAGQVVDNAWSTSRLAVLVKERLQRE